MRHNSTAGVPLERACSPTFGPRAASPQGKFAVGGGIRRPPTSGTLGRPCATRVGRHICCDPESYISSIASHVCAWMRAFRRICGVKSLGGGQHNQQSQPRPPKQLTGGMAPPPTACPRYDSRARLALGPRSYLGKTLGLAQASAPTDNGNADDTNQGFPSRVGELLLKGFAADTDGAKSFSEHKRTC